MHFAVFRDGVNLTAQFAAERQPARSWSNVDGEAVCFKDPCDVPVAGEQVFDAELVEEVGFPLGVGGVYCPIGFQVARKSIVTE